LYPSCETFDPLMEYEELARRPVYSLPETIELTDQEFGSGWAVWRGRRLRILKVDVYKDAHPGEWDVWRPNGG